MIIVSLHTLRSVGFHQISNADPIRNGSFHHPCYSRSQAYATKENDAVSTKGDYIPLKRKHKSLFLDGFRQSFVKWIKKMRSHSSSLNRWCWRLFGFLLGQITNNEQHEKDAAEGKVPQSYCHNLTRPAVPHWFCSPSTQWQPTDGLPPVPRHKIKVSNCASSLAVWSLAPKHLIQLMVQKSG